MQTAWLLLFTDSVIRTFVLCIWSYMGIYVVVWPLVISRDCTIASQCQRTLTVEFVIWVWFVLLQELKMVLVIQSITSVRGSSMHRGREFFGARSWWYATCLNCVNILEATSCSSHVCAEWASNLLGMHSLVMEHKQGHWWFATSTD